MTQNRIIPSFYIIHKLIATFMFEQKFYGMNVKYLKWKMKGNDGFSSKLSCYAPIYVLSWTTLQRGNSNSFWVSYHKGNKYYTQSLRKNILIS